MIINGVMHHVETPRPLSDVLEEMAIARRGIAVAINGEIVRRSEWSQTLVQPTDQVEVVTAVAGG